VWEEKRAPFEGATSKQKSESLLLFGKHIIENQVGDLGRGIEADKRKY
jgi:hypothetical protein